MVGATARARCEPPAGLESRGAATGEHAADGVAAKESKEAVRVERTVHECTGHDARRWTRSRAGPGRDRPTLSIIGRAGGERARRLYSNDVLPAGDPADQREGSRVARL